MSKTYNVADLFCGAGGESTGIMQAAEMTGMKVNLLAINHWERAIETHAKNHPGAEHLCESIEHIDPVKAVPDQKLNLLWASPACTHFSVARGGKPRSNQSRATPWVILDWLTQLQVERVIIENVPEFMSWGPLTREGLPVQSKKGDTFRAFITAIQSLGYMVDWQVLCAANYGDPTTRRRLFIQAVKGRKKIMWPEITHMEGINLMGYQSWRSAREIIDWSIPGASIFDRKKPLAPATIRRIEAGIKKYWGDYAKPFLAILHGTSTVKSIDEPLSTIACSGAHHMLVEPMLLGQQSGAAARPVNQPCPTVATAGAISLIEPLIMEYYGNGKTDTTSKPLGTVTTKDRFALMEPFLVQCAHGGGELSRTSPINEPVPALTCSNEYAVIQNLSFDIRLRMLKSHELKRAQGFPDDYILTGNVAEQVKQIGNAVPVNTARALALTAMSA
ncbi:MAG: DNA cytosine methyltransferase [Treponema sp.]|nr:DNA cytosine methyltransferase [Treponema sp.]